MFNGPRYTLKKGWGGKFNTATKKFEFYSETLKKGLLEHAKKYETTATTSSPSAATWPAATWPSCRTNEPPKRHGSVQDYPSRSWTTSRA